MQIIKIFRDTTKKDIAEVGGKSANLGEMLNAGLPVPDGFSVTADAYFDFLDQNNLREKIKNKLSNLDVHDSKALQSIAKEVQSLIIQGKISQQTQDTILKAYKNLGNNIYVAVRSSATAEDLPEASFAGQQATYLNIKGEDNLLKAVKDCWASLFTARAIFYRVEKKFDHMKVGIAVPVQLMVQADAAGIMFTIDPVTNNKTKIMIEAGLGLGETVVSGSITPDRFLVDKKTMKIVDREINQQEWQIKKVNEKDEHIALTNDEKNKPKISDKAILELAELAKKIESHYDFPQDTEWAVENDKVFMLQSRPVTTLEKMTDSSQPKTKVADAKVILKGAAASVGIGFGKVVVIHGADEIDKIKDGDVLVTEMTTPDFVPAMKRATAIVTDKGGRTCHAAIVSRELGIPCVVGTDTATKDLKNDQMISVDGAKGMVYEGEVSGTKEKTVREDLGTSRYQYEMPVTATKIYVNLAQPDLADAVAQRPVDGVGLLRAEFIIADMGKHPRAIIKDGKSSEFVDNLASGLEKFAIAFQGRPVIYRSTDFKTNEYRNLKGGDKFEAEEENPMIGYRGAARYLKEPDLFDLELQAIKKIHKANLNNLHLMIPFVRTVSELKEVLKLVDKSGIRETKDFKVFMMAEVPSNVILIEEFLACDIDGISIGSNDLTQLTLGVDRDNAKLAEEFDERDSSVMQSMARLIRKTCEAGKTVSICGQAPSNFPEVVQLFVQNGATSISVNPDVIEKTRLLVASIEKRILLDKEIQNK
ncbi:MAG: phosphoenolpyruvate synthase [bacterium]